jgi:muramoyltetrapeptide carboxypeptidase
MPKNITLRPGDEIRVVAPSDSWKSERVEAYNKSAERLIKAGYRVTFGNNIKLVDYLGTASAKLRADDLNSAFEDDSVKAIMALHGGFFGNEVLPLLDWDLIREKFKPLIGYSDNTVLINALYAKTGLVSFLGPNFGTLGYQNAWQYGFDNFIKMLTHDTPIKLTGSPEWYEDDTMHTSTPWNVLQEGVAEAVLLGGNIQSFYLLQGTEYQPDLEKDFILAIEADELAGAYTLHEVSRSLESILQLPGARQHLRGILIGRFKTSSQVKNEDLSKIIDAKQLGNIPVVSNLDFGHTIPIATLPIGGILRINAKGSQVTIEFV